MLQQRIRSNVFK